MRLLTSDRETYSVPSYRFEFEPHELDAIHSCNAEHGFAIVKRVIGPEIISDLKESIRQTLNPKGDLARGETRLDTHFIEISRPLLRLLEHDGFMTIQHRLLGTTKLTVHRSAAILKNAGTGVGAWHTDQSLSTAPPVDANDRLNRGNWPNGMWFYLEGTHPTRGGLAVIEASHRADWPGPEGFDFTDKNRKSFHRRGTPPLAYGAMDVPGIVPFITDPGDLIIFADRTYHGVFPHNGTEARNSVGFILRPTDPPFPVPWKLSDETLRSLESVPDHLKRYFDGYTGLDRSWRGSGN